MSKKEKIKAKMMKKSLENKMLPNKQVRTTAENKRLKARKELADRVALNSVIDTAKAEGQEIGFKPSPVIKPNHKAKNLKEPLTGFSPFSKAMQTGKKK